VPLLLYGRRLPTGEGDYFTRLHYSNIPLERFASPILAQLPRGELYAIINDMMGCPNGFAHSNALGNRVMAREDVCNTLNVYRCIPAGAEEDPIGNASRPLAPVLVYIHEGGWWSRSNSNLHPTSAIRNVACRDTEPSGGGSARGRGTIIVSINYRLGPYG